ncbi:hypothetical protein AVEN_148076-1, partial [Araneus ventricosus]
MIHRIASTINGDRFQGKSIRSNDEICILEAMRLIISSHPSSGRQDILAKKLHTITPMHMTRRHLEEFQKATHCNLCKKWLGKDRVRDHDHLSGKYRQALHNKCNLQLKQRKMIPCIFHNLRNYDGHLIMQGLGKLQDHQVDVIPNNMEKYISFSIRRRKENPVTLQFVDSFQFLNTSLQKLVENLDHSKFSIMKSCMSSPHRDLLLKKGIYPY